MGYVINQPRAQKMIACKACGRKTPHMIRHNRNLPILWAMGFLTCGILLPFALLVSIIPVQWDCMECGTERFSY